MTIRRLAAIGECMLEFSEISAEQYHLSFAGDTYNTAVYFQRCSADTPLKVDYVTALGDDEYSQKILQSCVREKIGVDYIRQIANQVPGLYLINVDQSGERHFYYYRALSPARNMFAGEKGDELCQSLLKFDAIYFSGITLAVLLPESRQKFLNLVVLAKKQQKLICFDGNYRPRLWPDVKTAQTTINAVMHHVHIAMPSFEDEHLLFGDSSPAKTADRLLNCGVSEVVVKCDAKGYLLANPKRQQWVGIHPVKPVDTTGAGDSFNGAYLAKRFMQETPEAAAAYAAALAAQVIQHRGAIIGQ